jgi:hypothetical protein
MCTVVRFLLNERDRFITCIMQITNKGFSHLYNTHLA